MKSLSRPAGTGGIRWQTLASRCTAATPVPRFPEAAVAFEDAAASACRAISGARRRAGPSSRRDRRTAHPASPNLATAHCRRERRTVARRDGQALYLPAADRLRGRTAPTTARSMSGLRRSSPICRRGRPRRPASRAMSPSCRRTRARPIDDACRRRRALLRFTPGCARASCIGAAARAPCRRSRRRSNGNSGAARPATRRAICARLRRRARGGSANSLPALRAGRRSGARRRHAADGAAPAIGDEPALSGAAGR